MFKKIQYGKTALCLALSLVAMTAHAGFKSCTNPKELGRGISAALCDFTLTGPVPAALATMCLNDPPQMLVYTITNNTPVTMAINYIRIQNNDGLPDSFTTIVTAPTNPCGSSLASGASCNIQVNVTPVGVTQFVFNRVLQVGIDSIQVEVDSLPITTNVNCTSAFSPLTSNAFGFPPGGPLQPITCTILGGSTVTNTGASAINGNVCTCPGTSITGFPPGTLTGTQQANTALACNEQATETTTFTTDQGLPCPGGNNLTGQNLGGMILTPGVYCFSSSAQLTGVLTLNGVGDYFFQIGSTLTTASASQVLLTGGATRDHVFWIVGSSATFGTTTAFQGNVLALASITFNTGASLLGRAGTQTGAITLDTNAVNPNPA